jgi:hypothetical protein
VLEGFTGSRWREAQPLRTIVGPGARGSKILPRDLQNQEFGPIEIDLDQWRKENGLLYFCTATKGVL